MAETAEEWKPVVGHEGIYEVSRDGRISRVTGGRGAVIGRILRPCTNKNGYDQVSLMRGGSREARYVHKVVAEAFCGPCPADHEVNHIDSNKTNNDYRNLEYVTHQGNIDHVLLQGRQARGEKHGVAKLNSDIVREIRLLAIDESQVSLAKRFGVSKSNVNLIVNRKIWTHVA